jgi:hypothetical protein
VLVHAGSIIQSTQPTCNGLRTKPPSSGSIFTADSQLPSTFLLLTSSTQDFAPETSMKTQPGKIYQLKLTPAQQQEIRELTGKETETVSLTVEELEERIAPGWTSN